MSEELDRIPIGKVRRAGKFITTGAKVGGNYAKHYAKAMINGSVDQEELDKDNAKDIYSSLSELKGSALKMAQLLSMDQNVLPKAYSDKFTMAQYSAPPLSYPLVKKTIMSNLGNYPNEIFDSFSSKASNAASMGQVHKAKLNGEEVAVKVQYPGVGDSIKSDLKLAKPFALSLMKVSAKDIDPYLKEVEEKLLEEADYELELKQSLEFAKLCKNVPNVEFPQYLPQHSGKQVLTMTWLSGVPLGEWMKSEHSLEARQLIGQTLWDFYMYQIHHLKMMNADPHPGNYIINESNRLGVIDFGCVKHVPSDFYEPYFKLAKHEVLDDEKQVRELFQELEIILPSDSEKEEKLVTNMFVDLIRLVARPINYDEFDFSDNAFFEEIYQMGEIISKDPELKKLQARGSRHFIYFNRTFFGLYNILNNLKVKIKTNKSSFLKLTEQY
ncbi:ABC1 kinase family protein [Reichenbachiella versicolor]|uniref:ABC1 kinase family protein n=1 Tax=Reichenbachiella versicolor TaxID=1821036 RepID=UPI000D6DC5FF|nr:AarF/ABC1/UbiB kinase family protein [Reichenbachiella versicolor]